MVEQPDKFINYKEGNMDQSKFLKKFAVSLICATGMLSGVALATPIATGTVYSFNLISTDPKLPSGMTLATVTLKQQSQTEVDVSVMLASTGYFAGTGVGPTFAFNLLPAYSGSMISLTGTNTSSFKVNPYAAPSSGNYNLTPDGIFTNSIDLTSTGSSAKEGGPLTFSIVNASGLWLNDFSTSGAKNNGQQGGFAFGVDMFYNKKTGSAAFLGTTPTLVTTTGTGTGSDNGGEVPEPASVALMGLGLMGVASLRKRNKAK